MNNVAIRTSGDIKPGYRTSEFWLSAVAWLLRAFFASGVIGDDTTAAHVAGMVG